MKSPIPASLSLLLLTLWASGAQTADDFFHGGAQHFLSNNIPAALEVVTNGLQRFPEDQKLQKLHELLNQQQQQQNQQDQKQQEQDQQDEQKQKQDQQKQDEKQDPQPSKSDEQKKQDQQKQQQAQDKKSQEKKDAQSGKPDEKQEAGDPPPVAAHAMTPQEAKQLLDAQKGDEQVLQFRPPGEPRDRPRLLKDW
jgi:outer membrane biosynthesis protein TonB